METLQMATLYKVKQTVATVGNIFDNTVRGNFKRIYRCSMCHRKPGRGVAVCFRDCVLPKPLEVDLQPLRTDHISVTDEVSS